jgi:hypothetical protein
MRAILPPSFAFTRGVSSEEDIVYLNWTRWCRRYRCDGAIESALFSANADALAGPSERAQETRCNGDMARARVRQPRHEFGLQVRYAMVKAGGTIDE